MKASIILILIISTSALIVNSQPARRYKTNARLVAANNQFGFDLFNQLRQKDKDKNIFFSPLSVATALEMAYNGADGGTQQAMAQTLKLNGMSLSEVNQASANLLKSLKSSDPKIELALANSLWGREGVKFKEDFLLRNRQFFGAEIASLNFGDSQAINTINNWVNKNTRGKIPAIISGIERDLVLLTINAIYFKGMWAKTFDKQLTRNEPFHLLSGAPKRVPMMSQSGAYLYYRGDRFQAVSLPYGLGSISLDLFLPDKNSSLNEFLKGFSQDKCEQWVRNFQITPGVVKIPRFKMEYENSLNEPLKSLGMEVAFTQNRADFSRMRDTRDLYISEVRHKAIVEVNEEGTEAAASTSVDFFSTGTLPRLQWFNFFADHPFMMIIRDARTGAILFMGVVVEPA